jgi:hypothetical protein
MYKCFSIRRLQNNLEAQQWLTYKLEKGTYRTEEDCTIGCKVQWPVVTLAGHTLKA